jgi:hypothetical protein
MTNTVRSEKRRAKARRAQNGKIMTKCQVCGREGTRRSMIHRGERWVCRAIPQCMVRTLGKQPEQPEKFSEIIRRLREGRLRQSDVELPRYYSDTP